MVLVQENSCMGSQQRHEPINFFNVQFYQWDKTTVYGILHPKWCADCTENIFCSPKWVKWHYCLKNYQEINHGRCLLCICNYSKICPDNGLYLHNWTGIQQLFQKGMTMSRKKWVTNQPNMWVRTPKGSTLYRLRDDRRMKNVKVQSNNKVKSFPECKANRCP